MFRRTRAATSFLTTRGNIKGTINNFGGISTAEYGPLLFSPYINGTSSIILVENNRQVLKNNPCKFGAVGDEGDDNE